MLVTVKPIYFDCGFWYDTVSASMVNNPISTRMMINPIISSNQVSYILLRLTDSSYPTIPRFRLYYMKSHKTRVFCMFDLMCTPFCTTFSFNHIFLIEHLQEFVTSYSTEKWGAISAQTQASTMVNNFYDNGEHTRHNSKFWKFS